MKKNCKTAAKTTKGVAREAQGLLDATEEIVSGGITEARAKLKDSMEFAQEKFGDAYDQTLATVKDTHKFIMKKPYLALGI